MNHTYLIHKSKILSWEIWLNYALANYALAFNLDWFIISLQNSSFKVKMAFDTGVENNYNFER